MKDIKMHITLRAIIRFEQMTGKSYAFFDVADPEDTSKLIYCISLCNGGFEKSFEVFQHVLDNQKIAKKLIESLEEIQFVANQFQSKIGKAHEGSAQDAPIMVGDVAYKLIAFGLDALYVLDRMELCDVEGHLKAIDEIRRERMEEGRLWTYFSILPHVDGKKLRSPRDLYPFPWEEKDIQIEAEKSLEEGKDMFEAFMNNKIK